MNRQQILTALRQNPEIPVLIVGGGVNGIGVLRDLALQGVDALLVEKSDFCAGTSAASGRVAHGGIRYLENGEFRLVREALHERNRMLQNAPHCVEPLLVAMPAFSWAKGMIHAARQFFGLKSAPGDRGALILKIGMTLYDLYSGSRILPAHHFESRGRSLGERPAFNPAIKCIAYFYDARIRFPERFCLELIQDAAVSHPGARALNYVRLVGASGNRVTLADDLTGETFTVQPQIVVNATGAWIDFANQSMGRETALIGGTKGAHLVVEHPELWRLTQNQMLFYVNADARICIFYAIGQRVLIGTTDIPASNPDETICDEDETDYLLRSVERVFPGIRLDRSHIVYTFSGVRPLPTSSAATAGQISRDHSAPLTPPGGGIDFPILSLVGGKWTTYRAFSEMVADELLKLLGRKRAADTRTLPVGGGRDYPRGESARHAWIQACAEETGLSVERIDTLLDRYGTTARAVARSCVQSGRDAPLAAHPAYSIGEMLYLAQQERVEHLDDVVQRRTMIAMQGETTLPLLEEIAEIIAPTLGWSPERQAAEVARTVGILLDRHKIDVRRPQPNYAAR
ncbi:MAG: glycerol-3-phosphate dehydrogenase/oxidase [Anaerolineae bacterium]|nr:glycerol-3-phosphate dehydrogenase/oxidase [Anaerolineae bacterium]